MPPAIPLFLEPATRGVADRESVPRETNSPFLGAGCVSAVSDWVQAHKPCVSIDTQS